MKQLFITLLLLIGFGTSFAQVSLEPKTIPAPNSASLGEYGAIPVGHYTGIPEIAIPLYELELDGLKLPLSLSYHASGVKVAQEASWVGMGWCLNAGGCIMRTVQGWDDFGSTPMGYYWDSNPPQPTEDNDVPENASQTELQKYEDMYKNLVDPEPDIFYFNFGGHSGKFFVQRESESGSSMPTAIVQTPDCYLNMTYDLNKWIVTDGDGFKFYFGTKEESRVRSIQTTNLCSSIKYYRDRKDQFTTHEPQTDIVSAWYLDSIVSPNRNKIAFTYAIEKVFTPMNMQESSFSCLKFLTYDSYAPLPNKWTCTMYSYSMNKQPVLKTITDSNFSVDFTGEERLDIEPWHGTLKPTRLSKVSIRNRSSLVKEFKFGYFYTGTPNDYDNCRLFLSSVQELGTDGSEGGCYTMDYNKGALPAKTSTEIDHWGYYTTPSMGMASDCWGSDIVSDKTCGTLIPPTFLTYNNGNENKNYFFYGRNRNSDAAKMCYGMLKSIKYPTGGQSNFTFEPCMTHSTSEVPPTIEQRGYGEDFEDFYFSDLPMDNQDEFSDGIRIGTPFEITEEMSALFSISIDYIIGGDFEYTTMNRDDNYFAALRKYDATTSTYKNVKSVEFPHISEAQGYASRDYELTLKPGTYRIDLSRSYTFHVLEPHKGSLEVFGNATCFVYQKVGGESTTETTITGGPRIQSIETTDQNGNVTKKSYEYKGTLLMSPLVYHYALAITKQVGEFSSFCQCEIAHTSKADYLCGMSSSYIPMSSAANGNYVGYSNVTETIWNGDEKAGSTVYEFYNDCDQLMEISDRFIPGFPTKPFLNNGLPKQVVHYNASGKPVRKETYEYDSVSGTSVKGIKIYRPAMETVDMYIKAYDLESSWNQLLAKTVTEYTPTGELITQTTKEYTYEPSNYKVKEVKVTESRTGTVRHKVMEYPANLKSSASCYQQMVDRQMLNPVVEERDYVSQGNPKTLQNTWRTLYGTFGNRLLPASIWQNKEKGGSTLEERMRITHYNKNGKPCGYVKGDSEKVVYLWGYGSMYPVAKIEGATYTEVESWLGASAINALANNTDTVPAALSTVRSLLAGKNVLVTTYTYQPLTGMTSSTAPNGEVTTYEYDSLGRLARVKDHNGKTVEQYDYHYKP